jgi:hypothetical protein
MAFAAKDDEERQACCGSIATPRKGKHAVEAQGIPRKGRHAAKGRARKCITESFPLE